MLEWQRSKFRVACESSHQYEPMTELRIFLLDHGLACDCRVHGPLHLITTSKPLKEAEQTCIKAQSSVC